MYNDIIFDAEDIIGYSWDIKGHILKAMESDEFDDDDLTHELLEDLEKHDGLVICHYHPMGAYWVNDLIEAA